MFAVPLQVSPASSSGHAAAISVQNLLDLGADTVLRSRDSCDIRVPKHYVAKFSPALGALIQGASNSTIPTKAEAPLPTVQLPESGATLISLLSFIIPIFPALPPTSAIEATMELLSAAQKYEMSSVLAHIRLCLAQQDPYFIHTDNAFRAYSLAQKYGLRQEAVKAARLTFKFPLALHDLVGRVDIMPGAHLHELWTFHERAQDYIAGGLVDFRNSSASSMLKGLECISCHFSDIPRWVDLYLSRTVVHPSHHDFVRFQKNWARHVRDCECILPEIVGTIWTAINTIVRDNMNKAEQALSVIGGETDSGIHIGSPTTPLSLSERVDVSQADVIVRSSDHVDFRVHKSILASSSPVFNDMFSLPKPSSNEAVDGLPIVQLSEDAELVRGLLTALYPIPSEMPASYDRILALLAAALKYDMDTVQLSIRAEISHRQLHVTQAFRTYAIASRWKLIPEMEMAARLSLDLPMTFESVGVDLRLFEGWALRMLVDFRMRYRDNLISCFKPFLDTSTGPSNIWIVCPGPKSSLLWNPRMFEDFVRERAHPSDRLDPLAPRIDADEPGSDRAGALSVPEWLHRIFMEGVGGLMSTFKYPLVGPSDIRSIYLSALQEHVYTDKCPFCMGVHLMEGEKYIVKLERALTQARNKTTLEVS